MLVFILKMLFALAGLAPYGEVEEALLRFLDSDLGIMASIFRDSVVCLYPEVK